MLDLQRTAGNTAVQRLVQLQRDTGRDAERVERLAYALSGSDWAGVATMLLASDEPFMVRQLHNLDAEQLRYLDDAVRRMHVVNSRLRIFIHAGLMQLGATPDSADPGAGYGTIEGRIVRTTDGKLRRNGFHVPGTGRFELTFKPYPSAVDATLIEFVQVVRAVSSSHSTPGPTGEPEPDDRATNGTDRETADHHRIDRLSGKDQPWYGEQDSGRPMRTMRPWRHGSTSEAWMRDTVRRSVPNLVQEFETAVICRAGNDQGKVYATVRWGLVFDANLKVTPTDITYFNKQSKDFELAVAYWNTAAERQGSTQRHMPAPR